MIGITIVTPLMLVVFTRRRLPLSWEFAGPFVLLLFALWLVVGVEDFRFQLFYLLFLPVIWMAVRFGLEGVTIGLVATQIGLIAAIYLSGQSAVDVTAFQALMIVLALTGLGVGVLVSEQRRVERQLRQHQDALARVTRLGSMGELAAAIAHEINQPLTAIANYTRLAKEAAETRPGDMTTVAEAASKAAEQVDRAAEVVRRLREFIRLGHSELAVISLPQVIEQAQALIRAYLEQHGILLELKIARDLPQVLGDSLQIQQVVLNLVRNAGEAIAEAGRYDGRITVMAHRQSPGMVEVCVKDNGPGFDPGMMNRPNPPFTSTKSEGMGLGLSLSRSIIESHHGGLSLGGDATGAVVCFTLPTADGASRAVAT
jgi:signal transduction histidine kinase